MMAAPDRQNPKSAMLNVVMLTSATAVTTAIAPVERIKLLLQCQHEMVISDRMTKPYAGFTDCIRRTVASEGFLALWRSNGVHLISQITSPMLGFALREYFKNFSRLKVNPGDTGVVQLKKNILQGTASGFVGTFVLYSLDYSRNRLACDVLSNTERGTKRQFSGMIDVYKQTIASDGIRGLYRGFVIGCLGIAVYRGLYFGLYDTMRPVVMTQNNANTQTLTSTTMVKLMIMGYGVALTAGLVSYPLDTVRRRMMMRSGEPVKYKSSLDCARQIIRNDGPMSFMNGFATSLFRGVAGAGLLVMYEQMYSWMSAKGPKF